jgi:hypothetical protein
MKITFKPTLFSATVFRDGAKVATCYQRGGIWELRDYFTCKPMAHENTRVAIYKAARMVYGKAA